MRGKQLYGHTLPTPSVGCAPYLQVFNTHENNGDKIIALRGTDGIEHSMEFKDGSPELVKLVEALVK